MWFIDPDEVTLYRYVDEKFEQVIPIDSNPAVKKFLCISEREYEALVEKVVEGQKSDRLFK